jgi:hypothetical protein
MWLLAAAVVTVVVVVLLLTFRSFRKWQQLPPDKGADAARAESFLSWMTRTRGDRG